MSLPAVVVVVYGLLTLIGGVIGYLKARSTASLIAGVTAGALLFLCAYGMTRGMVLASWGSLVMSAALGGRFTGTWMKHHRFMPDMLMVILSLIILVVVGSAVLHR